MRIYQYYLPVYYWCRQQLDLHRKEKGTSQPLVIGMQAPQVLLLSQALLTLISSSRGPHGSNHHAVLCLLMLFAAPNGIGYLDTLTVALQEQLLSRRVWPDAAAHLW